MPPPAPGAKVRLLLDLDRSPSWSGRARSSGGPGRLDGLLQLEPARPVEAQGLLGFFAGFRHVRPIIRYPQFLSVHRGDRRRGSEPGEPRRLVDQALGQTARRHADMHGPSRPSAAPSSVASSAVTTGKPVPSAAQLRRRRLRRHRKPRSGRRTGRRAAIRATCSKPATACPARRAKPISIDDSGAPAGARHGRQDRPAPTRGRAGPWRTALSAHARSTISRVGGQPQTASGQPAVDVRHDDAGGIDDEADQALTRLDLARSRSSGARLRHARYRRPCTATAIGSRHSGHPSGLAARHRPRRRPAQAPVDLRTSGRAPP